jgi:hypothetical protein
MECWIWGLAGMATGAALVVLVLIRHAFQHELLTIRKPK